MIRALALSVLLAIPAAAPSETQDDKALRLGGSTTLLPVLAQCASDFMEKFETWNKVDPSFPKDRIVIFVTGGGSGFGVKALIDGTVQVAMVSRELKAEEKTAIPDPKSHLVGKDGVAFAVNRDHPIAKVRKTFTRDELARIFSGEAKTWRELDSALVDRPITVFSRDAAGGSTEIVQKEILKKRTLSPEALQMASQGAMLRKLEGNVHGIGWIALGLVHQSESLRAFAVDGIEPSRENVLDGTYPLARNLYLVTRGAPDARLQRFIDFVLSDGQKMLEEQGYIAVRKP